MMTFQGDQDFDFDQATLWNKLSDAEFLVGCVPDATVEGTPSRDQAKCTVRPGLSFMRGTLEVTLTVQEAVEPASLKILVVSKGIGSGCDLEAALTLASQDAGVRVHWLAEVKSMTGLLKLAPSGLIRGAAQKVIQDLWAAVRKKVAGDSGGPRV